MDMLDRMLAHDVWTTRQLLLLSLPLTDADCDRPFDIGHETLRRTFRHLIGNMEVWTDLLYERPANLAPRPPEANTIAGLLARLDAIAPEFAALAHRIRDEGRWDETFVDTLDDPPVSKTYGGTIAHLLTHSHQHRSEALHILTRLGVSGLPEGDVQSWENATARPPT